MDGKVILLWMLYQVTLSTSEENSQLNYVFGNADVIREALMQFERI